MQGPNRHLSVHSLIASGRSLAITLLSLLVVAASASAQGAPPQGQPPAVDDSTQAMVQEYQEKSMELGELQNQALEENEALMTRRDEITEIVNATIIEINPEAEGQMARLDELQQEAVAAQEAQDMETLQALVNEAQGLQSSLQAAQAEALQREEVASEIEAFEADLMAAMVAIDPEAEDIIARLDELSAALNVAAGPGPGA